MGFKLIESVRPGSAALILRTWEALVQAGATFVKGQLVERPGDQDQQGGVSSGMRNAIHVLTISPRG
jgi:hypothetical protein